MASATSSQHVAGQPSHSTADIDPITKFKILVPVLKDSLQVDCSLLAAHMKRYRYRFFILILIIVIIGDHSRVHISDLKWKDDSGKENTAETDSEN